MFEKFIEFHKTGKHHFHKDDDTESTVSSVSSSSSNSNKKKTEGFGSFMILVFCIIFALIGGLVGFRWCKSMGNTSK